MQAITTMTAPALLAPVKTASDTDNVFLAKEHCELTQIYNDNSLRMASLVYGQCDSTVQSKIRERDGYDMCSLNIVWMLTAVHELCTGIKSKEHPLEGVYKALRKVFIIRQNNMSLVDFKNEFNQAVKVFDSLGVKIILPANVLKKEKDPEASNEKVAQANARKHLLTAHTSFH